MASCEQTEGKNKAVFTRSRLCDFSPHLTSIKWNFHIQNLPFVTYFFPAHPPHEPGSPFYRWSKMDLHSQMRPLSEILGGRHFIDIVHPLFCCFFHFIKGVAPPQNHFNTKKWGPTCCTLNSQGDTSSEQIRQARTYGFVMVCHQMGFIKIVHCNIYIYIYSPLQIAITST